MAVGQVQRSQRRVPQRAASAGRPVKDGARRRRHWHYAGVTAVVSAVTCTLSTLPLLRASLQHHLRIGDGEWGLLFSLGSLFGIVSALWCGSAVHRLGPVTILRVSLRTVSAGMFLIAFSGHSWHLLLVALILCSVASYPLTLAVQAYLTQLLPRERRRVLSLHLAAMGAGGVLAPIAMEWLLTQANTGAFPFFWVLRVPFSLSAGLLLGLSFFYRGQRRRRLLPSSPAPVPEGTWRESVWCLPLPMLWLALLMALHGGVDNAAYIWMPRYLESLSAGVLEIAPGWVASAFGLAYLISRIILSCTPEGAGRRASLVLPGLLGGTALLIGALSGEALCFSVLYVLGAFLWSTECPAFLAAMRGQGRKHFGTALALSYALSGAFTFLFTSGTGLWVARHGQAGLGTVFSLLAGIFIIIGIGGGLWVFVLSRRKDEVKVQAIVAPITTSAHWRKVFL